MTLHRALILSVFTILILSGCQGTGAMVNFDPQTIPHNPKVAEPSHDDTLRISVSPFTDSRGHQNKIGTRTHFWGGTTNFNAWNGQIGEGMANLAVDYLTQRKWQAALGAEGNLSDVTLSGKVLTLEGHAKSGFGFTDIEVSMKVHFEAKNTSDGSTVRTILGANGTDTVFFFSPKDMQQLTNETAKELFDQLFGDLTVKDRAFHLRSTMQ